MDEIADELGLDPAERAAAELHPGVPAHHRRAACRTTPATTARRSTARSSWPTTRASSPAVTEAPRPRHATAASASRRTSRSAAWRRRPSPKAIGISAPGWESSTVRMHPFGKVTVITGSSPHGQGHATSWSQIVATELGVPFDGRRGHPRRHRVRALRPRHVRLALAGRRRHRAATARSSKVKEKARQIAAHELECSVDDLEWVDGRWQVKGSPESRPQRSRSSATSAWVAAALPEGLEPGMEATTFHDPPNFTFPFGTHVCEVEIDPETGRVEVVQLHRRRRLRQRHQPDDRRRAGARRRHPVDRAGAVRGDGLRRRRPAADADAGRVPDAVGRRPAVDRSSTGRSPRRRSTRSASRASARPARSRPAPAVVNAAVDALSSLGIRHLEMPMQPAPRLGRHPHREPGGRGRDPARDRLHARRLARRGARRPPRRREADRRRPVAGPDDAAPARLARRARRPRRAWPSCRHPPGGRRDRDRRHDPAPRGRGRRPTSRRGCPRRGPGRGRHRLARRCATAARIGGSLAHADPHADLPAALLAVGGSVTVRSASGSRSIAAADLVRRLPDDVAGRRRADRRRARSPPTPASPRTPSSTGARSTGRSSARPSPSAAARCTVRHHGPRLRGRCAPTGFEEVVNGGGSLDEAGPRAGEGTSARSTTSTAPPSTSGTSAGVLAKRAAGRGAAAEAPAREGSASRRAAVSGRWRASPAGGRRRRDAAVAQLDADAAACRCPAG